MSFQRLKVGLLKAFLPLAMVVSGAGFALQNLLMLAIAKTIFRPRPDDIYVVTYPKSGTTLMQMMLYQLKSDGEMDFPHINDVCPWIEAELGNQVPGENALETMESPRCFKTHLLPKQLPLKTGRFIYIVRDVRDVVVSAYHHDLLMGGGNQSLEEFTERFLNTRWFGYPTWFKHLEAWWPHRQDPNVLFLSYEQILADLEGTVRKVADFCQIKLWEEDLPRIVERCGFAFMKAHQDKFDPRLVRGAHGFIRKGKAGSGSELLPRHREMFDEKLSAVARKLGRERGEPYRELISG